MSSPCIYAIANLINGKIYVGQTSVSEKYRFAQHISALRHNRHPNSHLQASWNKYGEKAFSFSVLSRCKVQDLDALERYYIEKFDSIENGYNQESGGNLNKSPSVKTRYLMSVRSRQKWKDPSYIKKMKVRSDSLKYGGSPVAKKVFCSNTKTWYSSIKEAADYFGIPETYASRIATGERKGCFSTLRNCIVQLSFEENKTEYSSNLKKPRPVICINTGEIFPSTYSASGKYGSRQANIVSCCNGKRNSSGKMPDGTPVMWAWEENYDPSMHYEYNSYSGAKNHKSKAVLCITTGVKFESTRQAATFYNCLQSKISLCCNGKRKHAGKSPEGIPLKWTFI